MIFETIGSLAFVFCSVAYLVAFFKRSDQIRRIASVALVIGLGIHGVALVLQAIEAFQEGMQPLGGAKRAMSFLGWVFLLIALFVQLKLRLNAISAFLSPLGTIAIVAALILPNEEARISTHKLSLLFGVHLSVIFVGIGCFCMAVLSGLAYLAIQSELKAKKLTGLFRILPSLEVLDRFSIRALLIGFVSLSLGLISGIYMAHIAWSKDWLRDPKVIFSFVTWIWYCIVLGVRYQSGWRGVRFFALLMIGFVFILFTFLGSIFFFPEGNTINPASF